MAQSAIGISTMKSKIENTIMQLVLLVVFLVIFPTLLNSLQTRVNWKCRSLILKSLSTLSKFSQLNLSKSTSSNESISSDFSTLNTWCSGDEIIFSAIELFDF